MGGPEGERGAVEDADPTVLIVGGGHSGLDVAVHLKALGVTNLVIEKNPRIGDNWRTRYEALCLHDPVCMSILRAFQDLVTYYKLRV